MFTSITDFPICDDKKHLKTLQKPSELRNTALEVTIFIITLFVFSVLYAIQAYKNTYFHFLPYPTQGSKLYPLSNILTFFFFYLMLFLLAFYLWRYMEFFHYQYMEILLIAY